MTDPTTDPAIDAAPRERTLLAWHRTALSVVVGALVLLRLTVGSSAGHPAVLAVIGLAAVLSVLVMVESSRRADRRDGDRGGRMALLLATSVTLLLVVEMWVVVAGD